MNLPTVYFLVAEQVPEGGSCCGEDFCLAPWHYWYEVPQCFILSSLDLYEASGLDHQEIQQ